jgi:hypothetical protein
MFRYCDTKASPWWVVPSDDKKAAHVSSHQQDGVHGGRGGRGRGDARSYT